MPQGYEPPAVVKIGSVHDLTQQTFNKVGSASDAFTQLTNGAVVGSVVPSP